MNNATVEDIIESFPHHIIPTVQGDPDYHTIHSIHSIRKILLKNAQSIETHLGGGAIGHLRIIVLIAAYTIVTPSHPWVNPTALGWGRIEIDGGMEDQLAEDYHRWEEAAVTFRTWNTVEQASKKQIITVFEPMYLQILYNDLVGFANTTARDIYLEHNFENMQNAWDPQYPM
jgi:hypothetical protein